MLKRSVRRLLVSAAIGAVVLAAGSASTPASAQEAPVTLIVGLTQPWETLNPVIGFAVPEYEFWNIQYEGLTTFSANDFTPQPGLAESWVENEVGLSYTYTLREGLAWSDGTPLTAEDIAWNINTSRDQEWANYIASVANLSAEVVDERTVTVTSSTPDPKLPSVGIYFVPKHIWEPVADPATIESYEALDGVGSGPFVLDGYKSEESLTMVVNENWHGTKPAYDRLIFRYFSNPDAMVAALQRGEINAAHELPAASVAQLEADPDIEVITGVQGGFSEIALNLGAAEGQPNPALLDIEFRKALNHGIDKAGGAEDLWFGLSEPIDTISVSANPAFMPEISDAERFDYNPAKANEILDAAGYLDTDGDGTRELPGGGENIVLRHAVNTDVDLANEVGELFSGWMREIGIGVELSSYDQDQIFTAIVDGDYDTFYWGWVPFVDPTPMLSYWTEAELGNFNDANWSDQRFEELYVQQQQELDPAARLDLVHEMLRIVHDQAGYIAVWYSPDIQAYRTDGFEGWVRQPAADGPIFFSQSSPSYALVSPVVAAGGNGDGGGLSGVAIAAIVVAALAAISAGGYLASRKRASADERE